MKIRSKLLLIQSAIMAIYLLVNLYGHYIHKQATSQTTRVYDESTRIVTTALQAQVHFKKQVQEWKNILLRGEDPALFQRYLGQFRMEEEEETRQTTGRLATLLAADSGAYRVTETFLAAHRQLGREYRQALKHYDSSDPSTHLNVDRRIRGIDRKPTDLLDQVVVLGFGI